MCIRDSHHIAYKTKAILDIATRLPEGSKVMLIGDNAEFDAFIYTGVRLFLEGRMDKAGLKNWLRGAKVEEQVIAQVVREEIIAPANTNVVGIHIRNVPGYSSTSVSRFDSTWNRFDSWLQVGWSLMVQGVVDPSALPAMIRDFHNYHGVPMAHIRWCLYRVSSSGVMAKNIQNAVEEALESVGTIGASGPSRRMCAWEFECEKPKPFDAIGAFDARIDSSQWYQSIEAARIERKRGRSKSLR